MYHSVTLVNYPGIYRALVDTGASDSFIDPAQFPFVLHTEKIPEPVKLILFGDDDAPLITSAISLMLDTGLSSAFSHRFLVTQLEASCPIVLGLDFLRRAKPSMDWSTSTLAPSPAANIPVAPLRAAQTSEFLVSDFFDPDEDPDEITEIIKVVPSEYHDFLDVFSKAKAEILPPSRSYDHTIDLIDDGNLPSIGAIYSTSIAESKALKDEIDGLLAKGFIRPSKSPIGAPVLFAKKKGGALRMCIDYRQLNSRTRKNKYPIPAINHLLERLSQAQVFTKFDLRGAYHLLRIAAGHEWKTTFRCRYGAFEFLVMPFGLTNAPSSFQHFVNDVFHEHLDKFIIVYLDDILIYSNTMQEHRQHVRQALSLLRQFRLFAKASKCHFHVPSVEYLGYIVGQNSISMDPDKVSAILAWPIPTSVKSVQSFLGFANFYRRFIREYSKVVTPLTALTKKDSAFLWSPACQQAFELLKSRFSTAPILAHFQPDRKFILETDASDYAIGSILSQEDASGILHPVAFDSRKLLLAELNYEIHDKELLAIVWSFSRWRSMLQSTCEPIQVFSDHKALEYFMSSKVLTRRQARWSEILSEYDFRIVYRPGKQSQKPDALSRRDDVYPEGGEGAYARNNPDNFRTLLPQSTLARVQTSALVSKNPELRATLGEITDDIPSLITEIRKAQDSDDALQALLANPTKSKIPSKIRDDGIVVFNDKVYVPSDPTVRLLILRSKHDHVVAGHPGISKTLALIKRAYYWPGAKDFVTDYVSSCLICSRNKSRRHQPSGLLQPLPVATRPWISISMDFIEELPTSNSYNSILVVVDRFTKMAHFIPTFTTANSRDLANIVIRHVFTKHGIPDDIISDRGAKFVSKFWQRVCSSLGILRKLSSAYHPQTDGQTERVNSVLEQYH